MTQNTDEYGTESQQTEYLINSEWVEGATKLLFYYGATLVLLFLVWMQVAPYGSTNPEWWSPEMARAAMMGGAMLVITVMILTTAMLYDAANTVYTVVTGNDGF